MYAILKKALLCDMALHSDICFLTIEKIIKKNYPCNRMWRPIGLSDVDIPTFSR
jgi:hypothetical protein